MTYFYGHLFAAEPEIQAMFPAAMDAQRHRLAAALTRITARDPRIAGWLADLGRAHRKFGVRPEHVAAFRRSLDVTVHRYATRDDAEAIMEAFDWAASVMEAAAGDDAARSPAWWLAEVTAHEARGADVAVLTLSTDQPYPYLPGQHASVQTPRWPRLWRPYSIAGEPRQNGTLTLHVRAVPGGLVSTALVHHTRPGDTLLLGAAAGTMVARPGDGPDLLCLAGGTGLAPLKAIIESVSRSTTPGRRREIVLYAGARTETDLYDITALRRMELDYPWLQVLPVTSRQNVPGVMHGTIAEIAPTAGWVDREVYISGPDQMITATVRALTDAGAPPQRLHYDLPSPAG
jgi:NAD(P)H-flavin reductase/truncated hemoglobin YjbI